MRLSILIPTHRDDPVAWSRLVQACAWAGPDIEVIIRDNSGSASKRDLLRRLERPNCRVVFADNRGPMENYFEALKLATGEFIYFVADDDMAFDRAIAALPAAIAARAGDAATIGLTGAYVVENSQQSAVVGYQDIDADDVVARVAGFLRFSGPNVLIYSPVRRDLVRRIFDLTNSMPFSFSFHDQIICLLYLLNGKFTSIKRMLYLYEAGEWETAELSQNRDLSFYTMGKLDPAVNCLHWFLCGFEGAALVRNSTAFPAYSSAQRQAAADLWFSAMFLRFKNTTRDTFGSPLSEQANGLAEALKGSAGRLSFQNMLDAISGFMALSSRENADSYRHFWSGVINAKAAVAAA